MDAISGSAWYLLREIPIDMFRHHFTVGEEERDAGGGGWWGRIAKTEPAYLLGDFTLATRPSKVMVCFCKSGMAGADLWNDSGRRSAFGRDGDAGW